MILLFGMSKRMAVKKQAGSLFAGTGEDACLPEL